MNWVKTIGKVGKGLGVIAGIGALEALTGGGVGVVVAPLGPWAPIAIVLIQAGTTAGLDWLKHKDDPK